MPGTSFIYERTLAKPAGIFLPSISYDGHACAAYDYWNRPLDVLIIRDLRGSHSHKRLPLGSHLLIQIYITLTIGINIEQL